MPENRRPARSLYLHVGLQKTGTSYLQGAMPASRDALAEQGVDLVPPTKRGSYDLMLAVRRRGSHLGDDRLVRDRADPGRDYLGETDARRAHRVSLPRRPAVDAATISSSPARRLGEELPV